MTRRSSVRANARRNYCELAAKAAPQKATPTPNPPSPCFGAASPPPQGGREKKEGGGEKKETKLTKRVRALYEDSAVPVREIAALAGVTERTLYKYVERHNWKRRYRVMPRGNAHEDLAAAAANRGRRRQPSPDCAPAKGAGGRFIRRDEKDKPIAVGLRATDPAGARLAAAHCDEAAQRAAAALAEAEEQRMDDERHSMWQFVITQLDQLERHRAQPGSQPPGSAAPDVMRDLYLRNLHWACDVLKELRKARADYYGLPINGEVRN
jgi:hypothetical protein